MSQQKELIVGAGLGVLVVLAILLTQQYMFFAQEGRRLQELSAQYRMYIHTVRTFLRNNNIVDEDESSLFPEDARIISSDNQDDVSVFLNRNETYLKDSMQAYLKEQQLDGLMQRLQGEDWFGPVDEQPHQRIITKKRSGSASVNRAERRVRRRYFDIELDWPIEKSRFWLSSFFGSRKNPDGSYGFHRGIDMAAIRGTPVKAAAPGRVVEAHYVSGYGNTVLVQHNHKYKTRYAHLDRIKVTAGQRVQKGTLVGTVGDTGFVRKSGKDASHLHFEVYMFGKRVNPLYCMA
ncbi:MAG TPA: M23 family metallopeptidase [Candidatus Dependentiae bacterium]|nr:M23 family metallopeptidase [Candidatus Dependentiae bacterium]HRQ62683.1 M23 family metallopeptidase [Candidatus Dependentiae bacterium]